MNAAIVHRGPDEGSVDEFGRCVLGHRRLQVIDLATGSQPVTNETGDVVAVQYVPGGTGLRGVEKLPPGHVLVAELGDVRISPYWALERRAEHHAEAEWLERVRE